jgi:endoglucanase
MRRIGYCLLLSAVLAGPAAAELPPSLHRGINITNWFRFPASRDQAVLRSYLDDASMDQLRGAGFTFVRLAVQSDMLTERGPLADAILRLQQHKLAVIVALFPSGWQAESEPSKVIASWQTLAPLLRRYDPAFTFPEILNEPVFAADPALWAALQHQALQAIRTILPKNTIVLTGADWGSTSGLLALTPEADANVIYSFHFYEPPELTALGAYRQGLDSEAMAKLPFPVSDPIRCETLAAVTHDAATAGLIRFYCAQRWDAAKVTDRIAAVGTWAHENHVNVIAGEFGATNRLSRESRLAWLAAVRTTCEQQGFAWALWGYDDSMGLAVHPPGRPHQFDPGILSDLGLVDSGRGK